MSGLAFEVCLDDVIVFSSTMDEHFQRLTAVLTRLRDTGLKLRASKCQLLQKHIAFLGHIVSKDGVSTDPEKVRAITDWPTPENLLSVCAPTIVVSSRALPKSLRLFKKGDTFRWTPECQEAFDRLKVVLTSAPVLAMPGLRTSIPVGR